MSWFDIIAIVIFIVFMPIKFVSDYHRIFKPWKEQKINQVKEWNRQRNNRTRELKKQIKEWNRRRNNRTRELIKQIKDWNRQRNQRLRDWKEWRKKRRQEKLENWKAWWDKNVLSEWEKATPFKKIYIRFSCIIGFALFILFIILYSQLFLVPLGLSHLELSDIDSGFALAFLGTVTGGVALFSGFLAILRSEEDNRRNEIAQKQADIAFRQSNIALRQSKAATEQSRAANRQADIAEHGLITDRINKAVESLGKINQNGEPVLEVRIGALYALERIAEDSLRDHIRIMKIICGYVYVRNPLEDSTGEIKAVKEDVRAALIIIGQRGKWTKDQRHLENEKEHGYELDLRHCNLYNADLAHANMSNALLINSTLEESSLTGAKFNNACLIDVNLTRAGLIDADFKNTDVRGAFAYTGDFSKCDNLIQNQLEGMYCGMGVTIDEENFNRPDHWPETNLSKDAFIKKYKEWKRTK